MLDFWAEIFSYGFIVRALLVGTFVSLCSALLGVSLVLKRYSMIGDGLSHVGFGALAVAAVLGCAPLAVAIPVVMLAAFLLLRLSDASRIKGDAAIGLLSAGSLAAGVMLISVTKGMNTDLLNYMFGSILAMQSSDVWLSTVLSITVLVLYIVFYNRLFAVTFDENFARAGGIDTGFYKGLLAFLTALTVVLGMRMMGALLISSLIIFPALSAMRLCRTYRSVIVCASVLAVFCFWSGLIISYICETPTGATVVLINALFFCLFSAVSLLRRRKRSTPIR